MSGAGFTPGTPEEVRQMLEAIGLSSLDELFAGIPAELRARSFHLPEGLSEFEMLDRVRELAAANAQPLCFVGGGVYDHFIPSVVEHLSGRAEFYTAYTPYQPECSQGTLQALYEYQTAICRLTGMEVSNASLYDGGTALGEAALLALRATGRTRILMDGGVNPFYRQVVKTYVANLRAELVEVPPDGASFDRGALSSLLDERVAVVAVQNPNFFGSLENLSQVAEQVHARGALLAVSVYPVALGLVEPPGAAGADIVTGDGQSLGNSLSFGGPSFGFMAVRKAQARNLPGRIVGETVDREGRRGYVLTLQAREQHIKRHRATSNICSNQSLNALRGLIFLSALGEKGFAELARLNYEKAQYAKRLLAGLPGVSVVNGGPTFNEFTLALPSDAAPLVRALLSRGIAAGVPLGTYYPGMERCMVVTVTEKRSRAEIERLVETLKAAL
ncbi:MAG: aminomethyl-transferring glycine dehydrogenase subunit GcvPA [Deltaproteobacteria bacterium]|nr:aminomethyl-transferring glycine dehydrogenase subunit GcvPA [Deltaproteobacteria bacterium]